MRRPTMSRARTSAPGAAARGAAMQAVPVAVGGRRLGRYAPVPPRCLRALHGAGCEPIVRLPTEASASAPGPALDGCGGLVLTGGEDVTAAVYRTRAPAGGAARGDALRDVCEMGLVLEALHRGLPVLAICRGMHLLNVALGGSVAQALPDGAAGAHGTPDDYVLHDVRLAPGSRLATTLGAGRLAACSSHHAQAVGRLGAGLAAVAWSDDGVIEAIEARTESWVLGVQWHPEDTAAEDPAQRRLFAAFAAACAATPEHPADAGG
jgi:putative glutamine amidotransferase